jgi:hypothetical protein
MAGIANNSVYRFHREVVMTRTRYGSWLLGVVVLLACISQSVSAVGPAWIVVHGGALQSPIVIRPTTNFQFMWQAGGFYERVRPEDMRIPGSLQGRRYLDYDVYWGTFTPEELKPEASSQHGRLYLPTSDRAAAVVITHPGMTSDNPNATRADATPIPNELGGFASGRALSKDETSALAAAGVPMK